MRTIVISRPDGSLTSSFHVDELVHRDRRTTTTARGSASLNHRVDGPLHRLFHVALRFHHRCRQMAGGIAAVCAQWRMPWPIHRVQFFLGACSFACAACVLSGKRELLYSTVRTRIYAYGKLRRGVFFKLIELKCALTALNEDTNHRETFLRSKIYSRPC